MKISSWIPNRLVALTATAATALSLSATSADAQKGRNPLKPKGQSSSSAKPSSGSVTRRPGGVFRPGGTTRPAARPDSGPRTPRPTRTASLVLFYYGDGGTTTAGQDTLRLKKAMGGYDKKVLLKHNFTPSWLDFSEADERLADIVLTPTKSNFFDQLKQLAADNYMIDVYIFAHGATSGGVGYFTVSNGTHGNTTQLFSSELRTQLSSSRTGFTRMPIRMVWGTNCYGSTMNTSWQAVGAKAVMGVREVNFYPNSFKKFIGLWNQGNKSFSTAVGDSITAGVRTTAQLYIANIHATSTRNQWGGPLPFGKTVLGKHNKVEDYFTTMWGITFDSSKSGKENMNHSSDPIMRGDMSVTKNATPTW